MIPSSIEILHALDNHEHPVCHSKFKTHIHEQNLACDFHFFNVNPSYLTNNSYTLRAPLQETSALKITYNFLLDYQPLSFRLRGPPAL